MWRKGSVPVSYFGAERAYFEATVIRKDSRKNSATQKLFKKMLPFKETQTQPMSKSNRTAF
jgi:hypothetical protein